MPLSKLVNDSSTHCNQTGTILIFHHSLINETRTGREGETPSRRRRRLGVGRIKRISFPPSRKRQRERERRWCLRLDYARFHRVSISTKSALLPPPLPFFEVFKVLSIPIFQPVSLRDLFTETTLEKKREDKRGGQRGICPISIASISRHGISRKGKGKGRGE